MVGSLSSSEESTGYSQRANSRATTKQMGSNEALKRQTPSHKRLLKKSKERENEKLGTTRDAYFRMFATAFNLK